MKIELVGLILVLLTISCTTEKRKGRDLADLDIRTELLDTLRLIANDSIIPTTHTGYEGTTSPQYLRISWAIKNATSDELKEMVLSNNSFVKAVGIKGLFASKDNEWFKYLKLVMPDTLDYIYYQEGCLGDDRSLPEFCVYEVTKFDMISGVLTNKQLIEINELIDKYRIDVEHRKLK